jgi:hypothetical protein
MYEGPLKRTLSVTSELGDQNKKTKQIDLNIEVFFSRVPNKGREIIDENNNKVIFTNTCTIDYYLLAIWTSWKISNTTFDFFCQIFQIQK